MFPSVLRHSWIPLALIVFAVGCAPAPQAAAVPTVIIANAPSASPTRAAQSPTATTAAAPPTAADPAAAPTTAAGATTVRLMIVPGKSEARYRVREQLVNVSLPSDAVGKTQAITGTIVGKTDGTIVPSESKFVVDLRTLQSDRSQRDGFLKRSVLQTDQFPNAVFVPSQTQGLDLTFPPTGKVTFKLIGDLTIRDTTKQVTWDATCEPQGNQGTCHITTLFPFEYFNLTQPRVPVVLSVENHITLEADLVLQPGGS